MKVRNLKSLQPQMNTDKHRWGKTEYWSIGVLGSRSRASQPEVQILEQIGVYLERTPSLHHSTTPLPPPLSICVHLCPSVVSLEFIPRC
jgi:hypothetical protein